MDLAIGGGAKDKGSSRIFTQVICEHSDQQRLKERICHRENHRSSDQVVGSQYIYTGARGGPHWLVPSDSGQLGFWKDRQPSCG